MGEEFYNTLFYPADDFAQRQKIRDVLRPIYLMVDGANIPFGLGSAEPEDRIHVTIEQFLGDGAHNCPVVHIDNLMVEKTKDQIVRRVQASLAPKFSLGGALKTLWKDFMEFLDEFGEEAKKNPAPIDRAFFWM